ncbi:MAG: FkbM family methyltransferase [Rhodospirillaceae bacterium]
MGGYERQEIDILSKTLSPNDRLLDIGAGIGLTAVWAAMHLARPGSVTVVEASPMLIELIDKNARLNNVGLVINWFAVTSNIGEVEFNITPHFWSSSTLPRHNATSIVVPSTKIENLIEECQPSYLMIDIEGGEYEAIIDSTLDGVDKICIEIHPHYIGEEKSIELITHILDIGFTANKALCANNVYFFSR